MLVAHPAVSPNMVILLRMGMVLLLAVWVLRSWLLKLVRHAHLHISLVALRAVHHHVLVLLVVLAEHAVGIVRGLRDRRA